MTRRVVAISIAAPWVAWALVRTLGLDGAHPVVGAMAYTPYAAASSPLPVVLALVLTRRVTAAVAGVAALALALAIVPRAIAGGEPDATGPRLTVMTSNVYQGAGDARTIVALARRYRVDVLSLQEVTPRELARLDAAGIRELLPGRAVELRDGRSGTAVLARVPLESLGGDAHSQTWTRLAVAGGPPLLFAAVHPLPPISEPRVGVWEAALDALPPTGGGTVRILAGDFNATLDHRALRRVLDRGYADAADRAGAGLRPTWPALRRRALPITIDHVLVDRRVRVERVRVERVPGSDHRALIADLRLPGRE